MTTSVIELLPNGGSSGWDRMCLGYDTTNPIAWSVFFNDYPVDFSLGDSAVAGVIDKITVAQRIQSGTSYGYSQLVTTRLTIGGTVYSTAAVERKTALTWVYVDFTTSPATRSAWTWEEIDALYAGMSVHCNYGASLQLYQFKVQVTYTPEAYVPPTLVKGSPAIGCGSMIF